MVILNEVTLKEMILTLDAIHESGDTLSSKTRFQKIMFLAQEEFDGQFDFQFEAAQYGPLSAKLNHALQRAKKLGLLTEYIEQAPSGHDQYSYSLTDEGMELLEFGKSSNQLTESDKTSLKKSLSEYGDLSLGKLLDYVHEKYPKYKLNF
ncbi:MAG: hypothetical protein CO032_07975 [Nitrosopumilales archaeon CG_4_9_14_0_2_um_filter_34_16]|nr:MAG: hypothetical protein CO032_07975 [Nitrosopumilales archaeon CG_4_9_14_0_2_um_filter_34_16]